MGKRRATEALVSDQAAKRQDSDRAGSFAGNLRALNSQFAQWVQQQAQSCGDQLWLDGVQDYAKHMEKLLEDYGDVVEQPDKRGPSPPVPSSFTLTPGPSSTPAAGTSTGDGGNTADMFNGPVGPATSGSTGRKSVTFAASPGLGTPAGAAAASSGGFGTPLFGTPRPDGATPGAAANTTHAGRTPAPAGGFTFPPLATPSAAATPSSGGNNTADATANCAAAGNATTAAAVAAAPTAAGGGAAAGQSPVGGFGSSTPGSFAQQTLTFPTPAAADPGSAKGSLFGIASSSSTPGADGSHTAVAWPSSSPAFGNNNSPANFSLGTSTKNTNATPGGDAAAGSSAHSFGFGTASTATAAAGNSSTPGAFAWVAPTSSTGAAAGSTGTGFGAGLGSAPQAALAPAPAAAAPVAANGGAGGGDGDDSAADEGRNVYKPEIQVDESVWNVYFKKKAKLHIKVGNANGTNGWSELGLGLLTVRQQKEGPNSQQCYILFSTDGGKQLAVSQVGHGSNVYFFDDFPSKCRMMLNVVQYATPAAGAGSGDAAATAAAAAAEAQPKYVPQVCMISLRDEQTVKEFTQAVEQKKPRA